jgi:hypothetical protein
LEVLRQPKRPPGALERPLPDEATRNRIPVHNPEVLYGFAKSA